MRETMTMENYTREKRKGKRFIFKIGKIQAAQVSIVFDQQTRWFPLSGVACHIF